MEVLFDNPRLAERCRNGSDLVRSYGNVGARKLQARLKDLESVETLEVMAGLPGHCHELKAERAGQLALDLDGGYRLVFRPAEDAAPGPGGGLDWSAVRSVVVVEIVDYHR